MEKIFLIILLGLSYFAKGQIIRANPNYIKTDTATPPPPPPPTSSFILDSVTGARQAYGLHKLRSAYAGSAIRVRRSNDNAQQDIGFASNELDETALLAFTGGNSGFVVTYYDQSGNGLDATNATTSKQPRIVNSGTVEKVNGKPALWCTTNGLAFTAQTYTDFTWLIVSKKSTNVGSGSVLIGYSVNDNYHGDDVDNGGNPFIYASGQYTWTGFNNTSASGGEINQHISYANRNTALVSGGLNGEVKTEIIRNTTGLVWNNLFQYTTGGSYDYVGWVQDIIMYNTNQKAERTRLERILNNYYTIY